MAFAAPLIAAAGPLIGSLGGASTILSAGSGLLGAFSSIQQGRYQAQVAKNNAAIAEQNAVATAVQAQEEAARFDRENAAAGAALMAAQGVSGINIGSRSSTAARALQRRIGRTEAADVFKEGTSAAARLRQDAANFRSEASNAKSQGYVSALGQIIGTGSSIAGSRPKGVSPSLVSNSPAFLRFKDLY